MKKGQAAIEFLMTYGWAILGIMLALGALAYFGVINPSKSLPEKCMFNNGITCTDALLNASVLNITLVNSAGQSIYSVSGYANGFNATCSPSSFSVVSDQSFQINCVINTSTITLRKGSPGKLKIDIIYKKKVGGYDHVASGEIYSLVR